MFSLKSKVALVTGAGRGIGRAIADQLAAAGATVMLNDLDPAPLEETASIDSRIRAKSPETSPILPFPNSSSTARSANGRSRHHRQQRRLHVGQRHPEDHRRAVPGHARYPRRGAVPHPARRGSRIFAKWRSARPPKGAAYSARWSTSLRSRGPRRPPARPATRPAKPPSSV